MKPSQTHDPLIHIEVFLPELRWRLLSATTYFVPYASKVDSCPTPERTQGRQILHKLLNRMEAS